MNILKVSRLGLKHFKILGVLAVVVSVQMVVFAAVAKAVPHPPIPQGLRSNIPQGLRSNIALSATSPDPNRLSQETYTPPDNGGPSSTQGSGTR